MVDKSVVVSDNLPVQNNTPYKPTNKERKLLEVLLNPEHRLKNITEICTIAGVPRRAYYSAFAKPCFVNYYTKESRLLIKKSLGPIVNASVRAAVRRPRPT